MRKLFCDRCGVECKDGSQAVGDNVNHKWHTLCDPCFASFLKWMEDLKK